MEIQVDNSGPLFDARAEAATERFRHDVVDDVAMQAMADVHQNLDASIRNPTPYYETQILTERAGYDRIVHDRDVIYGPWLEGVGSKNRTTRFKGYASFRRAKQEVEAKVPTLVEPSLQRYIKALGG